MVPRTESDEKYILDLVAEVLAEPDYRWQHRFPTLLGDPGWDGRRRPLPVDGYFPRHRLVVEYWERQHSAPVPIMDAGDSVSGVSRGDQRRLYDRRRQQWSAANGLHFVILDYRGFETDDMGRLSRDPARDRQAIASALGAAGVLREPNRLSWDRAERRAEGCFVCRLADQDAGRPEHYVLWQGPENIAFLNPYPTVYGSVVVAPVAHRVQVTGDLTLHQYLGLQRIVYGMAEAVCQALRPERVYIASLGSQPSTEHIQWQVVPCPPALRPEQQELALLDVAEQGVLALDQVERQALVRLLHPHLPAWMQKR